MLKVGLTGGLASGKSTVARMLADHGAFVAYADQVAQELMRPGKPVFDAVVAEFGREILDDEGNIARPKLAAVVFGHPDRVQKLNELTHPAVIAQHSAWMAEVKGRDENAVAVVEAALMIEAHAHELYDKLVVVSCPREQKIERYAQRVAGDKGPEALANARAEAEKRIAAQIPDEEKIKLADYVIENSGTVEELAAKVQSLWAELKLLASSNSGL